MQVLNLQTTVDQSFGFRFGLLQSRVLLSMYDFSEIILRVNVVPNCMLPFTTYMNFPNQIHTYHCGTDITPELCCAKENGKMLPFGFSLKKFVQISQRSSAR